MRNYWMQENNVVAWQLAYRWRSTDPYDYRLRTCYNRKERQAAKLAAELERVGLLAKGYFEAQVYAIIGSYGEKI